MRRKERKPAQVSAVFLIGYGLLRFIAEYFREPDEHLGLLSLGLSMGQWLCIPMILAGLLLWLWAGSQPSPVSAKARIDPLLAAGGIPTLAGILRHNYR